MLAARTREQPSDAKGATLRANGGGSQGLAISGGRKRTAYCFGKHKILSKVLRIFL